MRKRFADQLHSEMDKDHRIVFVTGDLGFGLFDDIRTDFPDQFINAGAAEQAMMGIGVGMALSGKIPVVYSITPFLLWRAAETIRNYINHESVPVKMVGSGRWDDYRHDGFSHFAGDDLNLMTVFPNINCYWPDSEIDMIKEFNHFLFNDKPCYLNLKRC